MAPRPARARPRTPRTPAPDSRQRILTAATALFAQRGFAATSVDRIAARAALNKAMIYYHFHSKQALYRAVLRETFVLISQQLDTIAASQLPPADKLDRFVAAFVTLGSAHPHFAPIMLREVVEGGRRLDEETYTAMHQIVRTITGIVEAGQRAGEFERVDPLLLYLTTVWPIMVYLATSPIRNAFARVARFDAARLDPERFIAHVQRMNRRAVMPVSLTRPAATGVPS